jgi:UDP-2,4-diacetamido-2,4,6-trideoxy-beta-L-altropyranose hydrolase
MGAAVALFRCDASPAIGAGHVTRCIALAESLVKLSWRVIFATGDETLATLPALATTGFELRILEAEDPVAWARRQRSVVDLLVVDHYGLDIAFERACRSWARRLLVLDDATGRDHDCDVLIDSAAADPVVYAGRLPASATALPGPAFAVVRRCFRAQRAAALARRDGRPVRNILLSLGATDPRNATSVVLDALDDILTKVCTVIVMSSSAPHREDVSRRLHGRGRLVFDSANLPELMAEADLAIGAAGASAFERAVLGLPTVLLQLADNQRGLAGLLVSARAADDGGSVEADLSGRCRDAVVRLIADRNARIAMAQAASRLVDGRGAERIIQSLALCNV